MKRVPLPVVSVVYASVLRNAEKAKWGRVAPQDGKRLYFIANGVVGSFVRRGGRGGGETV